MNWQGRAERRRASLSHDRARYACDSHARADRDAGQGHVLLNYPDLEKYDLSSLTRCTVGGQTMPVAKMAALPGHARRSGLHLPTARKTATTAIAATGRTEKKLKETF